MEQRTEKDQYRFINQTIKDGMYLDPTGPYKRRDQDPNYGGEPKGFFLNPDTQQPANDVERQKLTDWRNHSLIAQNTSRTPKPIVLRVMVGGHLLAPFAQMLEWIPDGGAASATAGTVVIEPQ